MSRLLVICFVTLAMGAELLAGQGTTVSVKQVFASITSTNDGVFVVVRAKLYLKLRPSSGVQVRLSGEDLFVDRIERWDDAGQKWQALMSATRVEQGIPGVGACGGQAAVAGVSSVASATIPFRKSLLAEVKGSMRLRATVTDVCRSEGIVVSSSFTTRPFRLPIEGFGTLLGDTGPH